MDVNRKRIRGRAALEVASLRGHLKIVRELLKSCKLNVNVRNEYEDTALTLASLFNRVNIVCELINHNNIDVNHANWISDTAHILATKKSDNWDVVRELIRQKHVDLNSQGRFVYTVLMWACLKGKLDVVSTLLKHETLDPNFKNTAGSTALNMSAIVDG